MQKDKRSKNNNIEKLRKILDNISSEDLRPKDEKYLKSLSRRLKESFRESVIYRKAVIQDESEKAINPLKPRVTIYPREEKKIHKFAEIKEEKSEIKIEKTPALTPLPIKEIQYEDEDIFEVEKIEVTELEFVKVKPKEITKPEEEVTLEEKKALADEELTEWEAADKPTEKEKLPEWELYYEGELKEKNEEIIEEKTSIIPEPIEDKGKLDVTNNFCDKCGAKLREMANFCPGCGNKIIKEYNGSKEDELEHIEKNKPLPAFIPIKKIEEKEEKIKTEEESFKLEEETVELPTVEEKEIPEKPSIDSDRKIEVFKDLNSINDETAVLLYDNGYTTIDALAITSLKDLTKIKGIKRNTAKKIKKEIEKISEWEPIEIELEEPKKEDEFFIDEEKYKKDEIGETDEKILEYEPIKAEEEIFKVEEEVKDITPIKLDKEEVFRDINSINEKIAKLLKENGINSIYDLRNKTIKDLTKIKGIKRKIAKKIKKEVEEFTADRYGKEIVSKETFERGENHLIKVEENEWESIDEDKISAKMRDLKGFRHGDYTLYKKEIETKSGKKRTIRFFSKEEPDRGEPIELPNGYEIRKNKKSGVPYLRKKK